MSDGNFGEFIQRERERLTAERDQIRSQQQELEKKLTEIDREFAAIEAYESAKTGRSSSARQQGSGRARRGSKRDELLTLIRSSNGIARKEILEKMGLKGDKAGEMSVSNALTALVKGNQVRRDGGRYLIA